MKNIKNYFRLSWNDDGYVLLCIGALTFSLFFFAPLEMILSNRSDYWFSIGNLLRVTLPVSFIFFSLLSFLILLLRGRARTVLTVFGFVILITTYLQGNLPIFNYGMLDGSEIAWYDWDINRIGSMALWLICIVCGIILCFLNNKARRASIIRYISIGILLIEIVTLSTLFIQSVGQENQSELALSSEGKFTLSREKNFVIFILDSVDGTVMTEFLEENPAFKDKFADFTFYQNASGMYPRTRAAIPYILTGYLNDNSQPYVEWLEKAYEQSPLFIELQKQNYDIRLFMEDEFLSNTAYEKYVDNAGEIKYGITSYIDFAKLVFKLVGTRYLPHELKKNVWLYTSDFLSVRKEASEDSWVPIVNADLAVNDDLNFNRQLRSVGLQVTQTKPAFRLYHLTGTHKPYTINEDIEYVQNGDATETSQLAGSLNGVLEYINLMKSEGIYDQSIIIVMADHGSLNLYQHPMLMIKPAGSSSDRLIISDTPVSFEDLQATFVSLLGGNSSEIGRTVYEIGAAENRERTFYSWPAEADLGEYLLPLYENKINGFAGNAQDMHWNGTIYSKEGVITEEQNRIYCLGDVASVADQTFNQYVDYGVSMSDSLEGEWSVGTETSLTFDLVDYAGQDLYCNLQFEHILDGKRMIQISINEHKTEPMVLESKYLTIPIDASYIDDQRLNLRIKYLDAYTPENEYRTLAVIFSSIKIDAIESVSYGEPIIFSASGNAEQFIRSGFSMGESTHRWSDGHHALMNIRFESPSTADVQMKISFTNIIDGKQPIQIYADDILIYQKEIQKGEELVVTIPQECFDDASLNLRFNIPNAHSSGMDTRALGLDFEQMVFSLE